MLSVTGSARLMPGQTPELWLQAEAVGSGRGGAIPVLDQRTTTTSELVSQHQPAPGWSSRSTSSWPKPCAGDRSLGRRVPRIAGNDPEAKRTLMELHAAFGFKALDTRRFAGSWRQTTPIKL